MNTSKVSITIKSDSNTNEIFELLKSLGVENASLEGQTVTGTAVNNLVSPLRSVPGVENVSVSDTVTDSPSPAVNTSIPTPVPTPAEPGHPWAGKPEKPSGQ